MQKNLVQHVFDPFSKLYSPFSADSRSLISNFGYQICQTNKTYQSLTNKQLAKQNKFQVDKQNETRFQCNHLWMLIRGPLISSGKYDKALLEKHVEKMMSIYPNYKGKKEKSLLGIILSIQYTK